MQRVKKADDFYSNISSDWDTPSPSIQGQIEPPSVREEGIWSKRHRRSSLRKKKHHKSRRRSRSRNNIQITRHNERYISDCERLSPVRQYRRKKRSKHHSRASRSRSRSTNYHRRRRRSKSRNRYHHNMKYHGDSDTEIYSSGSEEQTSPPKSSRHHRNKCKRKDKNKRRVISTSDHRYKKKKKVVSSSDSRDSINIDGDELELVARLTKIIKKLKKTSPKKEVSLKREADEIESNNCSTKKEPIEASTARNITKKTPKSTAEWKDFFDIELADNIDIKVDESIDKTSEASKPVVPNLSFDFYGVKQALATVKQNDKLLAKCEPTLAIESRNNGNQQSAITQSATQSQFVNDPRLQGLQIDPNHQSEFARSNSLQFFIDPRLQRLHNQQSAFTLPNYSVNDPRLQYFRGQAVQETTCTQASIPYYQLPTQSFPKNVDVDERFHPNESNMSEHGYGYASLKDRSQHSIESHSSTSTGYHKKFEQMRHQYSMYNQFERQKYDQSKMTKNNIHCSNVYAKKAETQITYCGSRQASVSPTYSEIIPSNIGNTMSNLHRDIGQNDHSSTYGEYSNIGNTMSNLHRDICQYGHSSTYGVHRRSRQSVIKSTSKNTIPETVARPSNTESVTGNPYNRSVSPTGNNRMSNSKIYFKLPKSAREDDGLTKYDTTDISSSNLMHLKGSKDSKFKNNVNIKEKAKHGQNMETMCSSPPSMPNAHLSNTPAKNSTSTAKFNFKIPKKPTSKTTEMKEVHATDDWSSEDEMDAIRRRSELNNNTTIEENSHKFSGANPHTQMFLNQKTRNSPYDKYKRNMIPICSSTPLISSSQDGKVCGKNLTSTTKEKNGTMELNDINTTNHGYSKADGLKSQSRCNINENKDSEDMPFVTSSSSSVDDTSDTIAKLKELLEPSHFRASISKDTLSTVKAAIDKLTKETRGPYDSFDLANKPKTKPRKNELDRLNEDIDASFIRNDVLYATGTRICSQQQHNYADNDSSTAKNKSIDDFNINKIKKKNMLRARSNTMYLEAPYKRPQQLSLQELKSKIPQLQTIPTRLPTLVIKLSHNEVSDEQCHSKKAMMVATFKNDNPECHSLKKIRNCFLCNKSPGVSLVHHYVNFHPDDEVVISRLAPDVADRLRNSENVKKCTKIKDKGKTFIKQFCHFCNAFKSLSRQNWIGHMAKHTGYYQYKCTVCAKKFSERVKRPHACGMEYLQQIPQPQFQKERLYAYMCDICNFIRFNKSDIETHISCQHGNSFKKVLFIKVLFLSLPQMNQKNKSAYNTFDFDTESECEESEYDWEFDEDYTKNLELEYQEEKRLEEEEEEDLREYLEGEALESPKENNEDIEKSEEINEKLDKNVENNMIPKNESHAKSFKENNEDLDKFEEINKELDKNEENNKILEDESHAESSQEISDDLDKFQEMNEELANNEENNVISKENQEDLDKSKEINKEPDKNDENNIVPEDESHTESFIEINDNFDNFEEENEELVINEENNILPEDENYAELEDLKTIGDYEVTPCNILSLDTQNEASPQDSTPSSVIVISDDEDDV